MGCYAPDGDHAEKVLENGLKANAAFISIFEESKQATTPSSTHKKGKEKQDEDDEDADESPSHTIIEGPHYILLCVTYNKAINKQD